MNDSYCNNDINDYFIDRTKRLGTGGFSTVYEGKFLGKPTKYLTNDRVIAIKILEKNENTIKLINREIDTLIKIRTNQHENLISFYDSIITDEYAYIMMEHCKCGSINKLFKKNLSEDIINFYFKQIVSGLKHLYDMKIMHRDIKPKNILLTNDYKTIKIIDFGLSKKIENDDLFTTICGSPMYMAP